MALSRTKPEQEQIERLQRFTVPACDGSEIEVITCPSCRGRGKPKCYTDGNPYACHTCMGRGYVPVDWLKR
jgi:DnaJ-class molecular chaperone